MSEVQLPEGWAWKKLGEIVTLSSEKYQPTGKDEFYVGLEYIEKGTGKISQMAGKERIDTVKNKFYPGDLLYGKLRPNLNKTAIASREGVCSTDILVFRPTSQVEIRYLHLLMITRQFVNDASANTAGVNLPRVSTKYLINYPIPLPPLPVQHQIVVRIEELFSELDAGVNELKTALSRLKTYRQAVLHHYLNNTSWNYTEIGKVCNCIVPNRDKPQSFSGNIYWVTIPDLPDNSTSIDYGSIKLGLSKDEVKQYNARVVPPGSVIMTCVGRFGLSAVVEHPLVINQQLHAFLPTEQYSPKFIAYTIRLNRSYFEQNATATTIAYLNKGKCNSMPIPVVDVSLQAQIVSEIEARLSEADAMEATIRQELVRAENLRQSILFPLWSKICFFESLLQQLLDVRHRVHDLLRCQQHMGR